MKYTSLITLLGFICFGFTLAPNSSNKVNKIKTSTKIDYLGTIDGDFYVIDDQQSPYMIKTYDIDGKLQKWEGLDTINGEQVWYSNYEYNKSGQLINRKDSRYGKTTEHKYSYKKNLLKVHKVFSESEKYRSTTYKYDKQGRPTIELSVDSERKHTCEYSYSTEKFEGIEYFVIQKIEKQNDTLILNNMKRYYLDGLCVRSTNLKSGRSYLTTFNEKGDEIKEIWYNSAGKVINTINTLRKYNSNGHEILTITTVNGGDYGEIVVRNYTYF